MYESYGKKTPPPPNRGWHTRAKSRARGDISREGDVGCWVKFVKNNSQKHNSYLESLAAENEITKKQG